MPTRILMACLLLAVMLYSGYDTLFPRSAPTYQDQVAVLMYHHVHDTDLSSSTVSTALFREQLSYLQSRGYHFISLSEFKKFRAGGPVPPKAVLVTFDDGYKSFHDYAYPVLRELDVPAVNFIISKDLDAPLAPSIPALSREEIREMLQEMPGRIDIQCHTNALHYKEGKTAALTGRLPLPGGGMETAEEAENRVRQDTAACAQRLAALYGREGAGDTFAYPYGIYTPLTQKILSDTGFRYAFTIVSEMAARSDDPLAIPRINAGNPEMDPRKLDLTIQQRVIRPAP
ncbi:MULTISPECIES: polysaccharide deacetylase family protein [Paenibacillus]|uniref:polysaccharide deacetylase family protein n=1 Tax=Paenibacillus TaxID=44249 RepID=UPI0022B8E3B4|nr:polysaccharide deacetylase family protein [Paenibacillus caseinilyticus]MCZ8523178.1 polysaccharide deacetylase family protein [Paenibacillus caseinilyticus]